MITNLTKQDLIEFEESIANSFNNKEILAPIHLDNGNESELIKVFQEINEDDWIFGTWRMHEKCLLKGVPKELLKQEIIKGRSISLCFPEYRIFSSGIVTGSIPIALGTALSIKLSGGKNKVFVFLGDMGSETGIMWECFKYSVANELPIKFIIEDNNLSVCTDTRKTWNVPNLFFENISESVKNYLYYFKYSSKFPHAGAGERIQF